MLAGNNSAKLRFISGNAGWFVAGALAVALAGIALYAAQGGFGKEDKTVIELSIPNVGQSKIELPNLQEGPMTTPTTRE
ncbi:MAG: hypothetical protein ACK4MX_11225 [Thermaurantiacus sp.]|uniref:Uncharacterized protein n=1 Tax=Pannonibacter phragmitetus TaxID=121719 RepID=A0A378ZX77_9HYPH|nr:hypothetical protein [Pannonibacter phragmitetus]SUB01836.1 Uncharacterised protein [Pannonibacter phragmitetus]